MRIVHVLPALTKGGAERVAVDLANAQAGAGHEVAMLLAYPVDSALLQDDLDARIQVRFVRRRRSRFGAYASLISWVVRHRKWLNSRDILHCHLSFGAVVGTVVQILRGSRPGARPAVVETYHAVGLPIPYLHRVLHRAMISRRDRAALMAADSYWKRFASKRQRIPPVVIPNGVPVRADVPTAAEVAAYRSECGIPLGALVIGTVGRLVPARHPDRMIEVFSHIARVLPDAHFLWAGDGPKRALVMELADQCGISSRLHLPGLLLRPALAFANIDLYLSLNVGSVTGIAALEAAVAGCAIVALQADATHQPSGDDWISSFTDAAELARLCAELLQSNVERARLAKRQRRHVVEHHGIASVSEAYFKLYTSALQGAA